MSVKIPEEQRQEYNKRVRDSLAQFSNNISSNVLNFREVYERQSPNIIEGFNQERPISDTSKGFSSVSYEFPKEDVMRVDPEELESKLQLQSVADSIRGGDGEFITDPVRLLSLPMTQAKAKAMGLADNNLDPTADGEEFGYLQEAGIFDENGIMTDKARHYMVSEQDLGKPENLDAFKTQFDDGLIRDDFTFGQATSAVGKLLGDAVMAIPEMGGLLVRTAAFMDPEMAADTKGKKKLQELEDRANTLKLAMAQSAVENVVGLANIGAMGSAMMGDLAGSLIGGEYEKNAEALVYSARQRQWQSNQLMQDMKVGEMMEAVFKVDGSVKEADDVKSRMGSAEFNKLYGRFKAFGDLAADPTNFIPASVALKVGRSAPLSTRIKLKAQKTLGDIATIENKIIDANRWVANTNSALVKEQLAARLVENIGSRAATNPELAGRLVTAQEIARKTKTLADELRSGLPKAMDDITSLTAQRNSLATKIPEAYANGVIKTMEVGRAARALPARTIGSVLEGAGNSISKIDSAVDGFLSERGLDKFYTGAVGAAGMVGLAGSPVIGGVAAAAALLKTGRYLAEAGKMLKYVGKEMGEARGQIPFWTRVGKHTAERSFSRGVAHAFNIMDLGGASSDIIRRTGRGVAAAAPIDLMFEYLSDGADMRPETLYSAAAESMIIGGSFAAGGGALMSSKSRARELAYGDLTNFNEGLTDTRQKALFNELSTVIKKAVATYSIANPTLNYEFSDAGGSNYDPNTNTATINVRSSNPIKALLAHETLHHTLIKNRMEGGIVALYLGDVQGGTVGGLLRSTDGSLDPNFKAFVDEYQGRLKSRGMTDAEIDNLYPLDKIAVEYFIDQHADQYGDMAESGELGAVAGSGDFRRKMASVLETILPRMTVLRDMHVKSGGAIDDTGAWVTGNGLLGEEGIKQLPATQRMFREMNRRSSGKLPGSFAPLMGDTQEGGAGLSLNPLNRMDVELLHPLVRTDANGQPVMQNGQPLALDGATELQRALMGMTVTEALKKKRSSNYLPEKGEAFIDEDGKFVPGWLPQDVIREVFSKNNLNGQQKKIIADVNRLIKNGIGERMVMINFPATTRNRANRVIYKTQGATIRDTVPVALTVTKDGNLLFGLMSVNKLQENISKRSQSKRGKRLYAGNIDQILKDAMAMMEFHRAGADSIEFFNKKYGSIEGRERKNFINTVFGLLNKAEQTANNPLMLEDNIKSSDNVYRTYRADRVSKAVPMSPEEHPVMPFSYKSMVQNQMPEQTRQMPEKRLATGQNQAQEPPLNERQPSTIQAKPGSAGTGGPETQGGGLRGQGGLPRGTEQLQPLYSPRDSGIPLEGLPATVRVPGLGKVTFGPNETARQVAADYAKSVGIDYNPPKQYAEVDEARATRIAAEYDKMPHAPNDPKVKASYDAMIKETLAQWEAIKKTGLKVEAIPAGAPNPYEASPRLAVLDVNENNHLWFFPTEEGFGTAETADIDISGNPLMAPTGEILNGHKMLANDVFRVVHDYFGHIKEGVGFRADGEENAWRSHSAMYSDLARPAMTAETRGQNSWVNYGPYGEHNRKAKGDTIYAPQKTGIMPDWVMSEGAGDVRYMPEKGDVDGDKGISAPSGSLGELRRNVEIKSSELPKDTKSNPKFVARTGKEEPWKVMDGPLRIRSGNYLTPLPNIKIEKTKEFSVQNQDLIGNALNASQPTSQNPKEIKKQQIAESNVLASLDKINSAIQDIENDPFKFVDVKGYAEIMKKSGVAGDVLIPPSSLKIMLNNPDYFAGLLSGGYHGDKTVAGIRESAMSGLDAVVEMRQIINGRPPELITALHHLWGTLSKQLPPLQQEALWMRMIVNKKVMDQIQASIDGTFNLTPEQWKNIVSSARSETVGTYGKLGENATSNANSFYLMLNKHNGRWNEVSDVYKNDDAVKMRYAFNTLGHGATGIKNKVQSFIGLTFGIKGNVLDRWRFVDMYLDDAMKITGAKTPRDYFKYEGKLKNVPVDKIGIYKNYGTLENNQSLFSLMLYSAMDRVSQIAIDSSPSMQQLLGNHADPGGLHWLSWNAIKNEAVGHSSLDITKNFIKKYKTDGDFSKLTVDNFLEFVNNTEAFVEGTSGAGNEITRLTLKNGTFNYSKK